MPKDFVSNWLCWLGKSAFKMSGLTEHTDAEEITYYRILLGSLSLLLTLVLIYTLAAATPDTLQTLLQLLKPASDTSTWLTGVGWVVHFVLWLFLSPLFVGTLYALRVRKAWYPTLAAVILGLVALMAFFKGSAENLMPAAALPILVAVCPAVPQAKGQPGSRVA